MSVPVSYSDALAAAATAYAAQQATPKSEAVLAVVTASSTSIIAVRERAAVYAKSALRTLWATVNPYSDKSVQDFATQAARVMQSAQTASVRGAAAAMAQQLSVMGVRTKAQPTNPLDVRARGVKVHGGALRLVREPSKVDYADGSGTEVSVHDMSTEQIFTRPAVGFRWIESEGGTREDAARESGLRIDTLVDDNLMLAQRLAQAEMIAQAVDLDNLDKAKITGYRRVIHPEMSRSGACGLCIAAADRIYHVAELLPIHTHCKCTIAAVTAEFDPADELNAADLSQLYTHAGGTSAAHLKRTRYQVDHHGELGPVLVPKKPYKPRDPKKRAAQPNSPGANRSETKAQIAQRLLPALEQSLADLTANGAAENSPQVVYHRTQIAKLRADLTA
ncbi:Uncharacterised protein [Mycobacteroides abscessus subsp. massiliense]|uniref:hypothetical protein n=1 Tax=Mycobacteroides abscessus TaxID=36809 RepID=UPI0009A62287|nr:hypothetical protein [Mycobacteroides abscessus]SKD35337.1 Uncharacterised protein [Mycobacteroides abscessus subsp. massiliense]SKD35435.1 Uncharacterised protein [Mycobacteroides abscessus subsp. massiliense]SKD48020.1 Uncharacterised protein [Mycobacteroides abscessus subsp. massiliense]SKD50740.1 Uncharacterised protein [Mycobacteroides abscessus subsp. massiliense]SKD59979.1 Uncharacterised protein [Mycobacteroides abscessus subsp. massiliense]